MSETFSASRVTDNVFWVGAIDWDIRDFHGYSTSRGTTYNAFLILADKITLIDTVKKPFKDVLLARIASVLPPENIDTIISNHAEMDHSGCLPEIIQAVKPEKVFASTKGVKALTDHFHTDLDLVAVKNGDRLDLGNMTVSFLETPMLHWPESIFTYLEEEKMLFSQDAFGMHLAGSERFDDEVDQYILEFEAAKYFANILMPYSNMIKKLPDKIREAGLEFRIIAPDHGPIWRKGVSKILDLYDGWAEQRPTQKVIVTYDTMWGSTELMARAICDGLIKGGAKPKMMPLRSSHRSDVATEVLNAGGLIVGSPTLNGNMFPTVADLLTYLRGLKPKNLVGAAFGSYGWACKGVPQVEEYLDQMSVENVGESVRTVYVPKEIDLEKCIKLGLTIAEVVTARCQDG